MNNIHTKTQLAFIDGLRQFADFLEKHPKIKIVCDRRFDIFVDSKDKLRDALQGTGHWKKGDDLYYVTFSQMFGSIKLEINISHECVCEKIVTGTKTIPRQDVIEEHEEEVFKWRCPDSFLHDDGVSS